MKHCPLKQKQNKKKNSL